MPWARCAHVTCDNGGRLSRFCASHHRRVRTWRERHEPKDGVIHHRALAWRRMSALWKPLSLAGGPPGDRLRAGRSMADAGRVSQAEAGLVSRGAPHSMQSQPRIVQHTRLETIHRVLNRNRYRRIKRDLCLRSALLYCLCTIGMHHRTILYPSSRVLRWSEDHSEAESPSGWCGVAICSSA